mgnify:CR=1 FL=1
MYQPEVRGRAWFRRVEHPIASASVNYARVPPRARTLFNRVDRFYLQVVNRSSAKWPTTRQHSPRTVYKYMCVCVCVCVHRFRLSNNVALAYVASNKLCNFDELCRSLPLLLHCGTWSRWFGGLIRGSERASAAERKIYGRWEDEGIALWGLEV